MSNPMAQKATASQKGSATIKYGPQTATMPVAGMTVKEVRSKLENNWKIPGDSTAMNGKTALSDDHVIGASENIEFVRRIGEKG